MTEQRPRGDHRGPDDAMKVLFLRREWWTDRHARLSRWIHRRDATTGNLYEHSYGAPGTELMTDNDRRVRARMLIGKNRIDCDLVERDDYQMTETTP